MYIHVHAYDSVNALQNENATCNCIHKTYKNLFQYPSFKRFTFEAPHLNPKARG